MHNDLKSANLLVDRAGCLKVCDFGMSRLHGRQNPEQELHSPAWMAPEVLRGDDYNASADVYSFGVVLWELATLQIPWEGVNRHAIRYWVVEKETHLPFVTEGDVIEGA
jgi:sterile alpha motif and leucine zipper-containing kinase AZK